MSVTDIPSPTMAMNNPVTSPISFPKPSLTAIDISYLATALELQENDLRTLLTAPTAELANKFAASASTKIRAYDKLESGERNDATGCSPCFPFMSLPPELRLQVYESLIEDMLHDAVHKGTLDEFPESGIRPRLSHRAALRLHIKAVTAILQTCRTVRREGAGVALRIAERYAKSTKSSLKQLGEDCKDHGKHHKMVHDGPEWYKSDCVYERYRELSQRHSDLCVVQDALWIVNEDVSENRSGKFRESDRSVEVWRWLGRK
jgi:hypothetical protein